MAWKTSDHNSTNDDTAFGSNLTKNWSKLLSNVLSNSTKNYIYGTYLRGDSGNGYTPISIAGLDRVNFIMMYRSGPNPPANTLGFVPQATMTEVNSGFNASRNNGSDWYNAQHEYTAGHTVGMLAQQFKTKNSLGNTNIGGWALYAFSPTSLPTGVGWGSPSNCAALLGWTTSVAQHDTLS